jgi:hypothetical protein
MASRPSRSPSRSPSKPARQSRRPPAAKAKTRAPPARKSAPPPKKGATKSAAAASKPSAPEAPASPARGDQRLHVLSLSFLRDGDEFLARLETDGGQITELKNRSLDQLLTLVASELEDLLE